jgi:hypothetical protein
MKLKSFHAKIFDESLCFARTHPTFMRVDTGEGNHHIGGFQGGFRHFFVRNPSPSRFMLGVDTEHDKRHVLLPVIRNRFLNGRPVTRLEILGESIIELRPVVVMGLPTRYFGVGMDIDGNQRVEVQAGFGRGGSIHSSSY